MQAELDTAFEEALEHVGSSSPFHTGDTLLRAAGRQLQEKGVDQLDLIVAAAKKAYDEHVAPIDIPYVPNFIEPMLDEHIWLALEISIREIARRFAAAA